VDTVRWSSPTTFDVRVGVPDAPWIEAGSSAKPQYRFASILGSPYPPTEVTPSPYLCFAGREPVTALPAKCYGEPPRCSPGSEWARATKVVDDHEKSRSAINRIRAADLTR
jgi:hypothetical protein